MIYVNEVTIPFHGPETFVFEIRALDEVIVNHRGNEEDGEWIELVVGDVVIKMPDRTFEIWDITFGKDWRKQ